MAFTFTYIEASKEMEQIIIEEMIKTMMPELNPECAHAPDLQCRHCRPSSGPFSDWCVECGQPSVGFVVGVGDLCQEHLDERGEACWPDEMDVPDAMEQLVEESEQLGLYSMDFAHAEAQVAGLLSGETGDSRKLDYGKPRMDLIPSRPLIELAKVYQFGAAKYSDNGWRAGIEWHRVIAALYRHLAKYNGGEDIDPETGLSHMAAVAWNAFALLEYEVTHRELDDRYKG